MGKDCHVVIRRERVDHPVPDVDVESYIMEQRSSSRRGGVGAMGGMQEENKVGCKDSCATAMTTMAVLNNNDRQRCRLLDMYGRLDSYQQIVSFIHVSYATLSLLGRTIRI